MADQPIKSILVVRLSSIGDIILTTPVVRSLRVALPDASIDYVTKKQYADLVLHHPALRKVYSLDTEGGLSSFLETIRSIRSENYDLILDLHVNPRSLLIRVLGGVGKYRRYYKLTLKRQVLRLLRLNLLRDAPPVIERYFSSVSELGIRPDGLGPELYIDQDSKAAVSEILANEHLGNGRPLVGLAPGASRFTKRWPEEKFIETGISLMKELDSDLVILGGKHDMTVNEKVRKGIEAKTQGKVLDLTGSLQLLETAAAIQKLDILISNDTGLMHMATSLDTPVVAVFGPTSRELGFFPAGEKARVVEADLDCRPCSLHGDERCPKGHFRCMKELEPGQVVKATKELLINSSKFRVQSS